MLAALLVVISCLVLKCLGEWRLSSLGGRRGGGERSPLMGPHYVSKTVTINYGTCQHGDLESGSCSNANGRSSDATLQCWEELYDAKICVICYDQPRNCFLVPCGHCATCHDCALRWGQPHELMFLYRTYVFVFFLKKLLRCFWSTGINDYGFLQDISRGQ